MEQTPIHQSDRQTKEYRLLEDPLLLGAAQTDETLAKHLDNLRQTEGVLLTRKLRTDFEIPASLQEIRNIAEEELWRYIGQVGYATSEPHPEEGTTA